MTFRIFRDKMGEPEHDKWVPVNTAWRVLSLWMDERSPIWKVAAHMLNKQS
jgi:hypothetical protein